MKTLIRLLIAIVSLSVSKTCSAAVLRPAVRNLQSRFSYAKSPLQTQKRKFFSLENLEGFGGDISKPQVTEQVLSHEAQNIKKPISSKKPSFPEEIMRIKQDLNGLKFFEKTTEASYNGSSAIVADVPVVIEQSIAPKVNIPEVSTLVTPLSNSRESLNITILKSEFERLENWLLEHPFIKKYEEELFIAKMIKSGLGFGIGAEGLLKLYQAGKERQYQEGQLVAEYREKYPDQSDAITTLAAITDRLDEVRNIHQELLIRAAQEPAIEHELFEALMKTELTIAELEQEREAAATVIIDKALSINQESTIDQTVVKSSNTVAQKASLIQYLKNMISQGTQYAKIPFTGFYHMLKNVSGRSYQALRTIIAPWLGLQQQVSQTVIQEPAVVPVHDQGNRI